MSRMIEEVARAMCAADKTAPEPDAPIYIGTKQAKAWEGRVEMATAALEAHAAFLAEKGMVIVPREPSFGTPTRLPSSSDRS